MEFKEFYDNNTAGLQRLGLDPSLFISSSSYWDACSCFFVVIVEKVNEYELFLFTVKNWITFSGLNLNVAHDNVSLALIILLSARINSALLTVSVVFIQLFCFLVFAASSCHCRLSFSLFFFHTKVKFQWKAPNNKCRIHYNIQLSILIIFSFKTVIPFLPPFPHF